MDTTLPEIADWMVRQRWYAGGARVPVLGLVDQWEYSSPEADARVFAVLLRDEGDGSVYHVPLVERSGAEENDAVIARSGDTSLVDGTTDPAFTRALLRTVTTPREEPSDVRVLAGEQSNTSLIFRFPSDVPIICKVFRLIEPGKNPDVEITMALTAAGVREAPRGVGAATRTGASGEDITLAFAEEFLDGSEDAWRVALRAADAGTPWTADARALGEATASVHRALSHVFDTVAPGEAQRRALGRSWRERAQTAVVDAPALAAQRARIDAVYRRAEAREWPPLQRIHGDYHLGQVLHVPGRGWVILDFEGEPLRPLAERSLPDSPLRDLAGMLRSFDYAEAAARAEGADAAAGWAATARGAFLEGYASASGAQPDPLLLVAFELDKALYETSYEARQRPDWLSIPLAAVARLLDRAEGAPEYSPGVDGRFGEHRDEDGPERMSSPRTVDDILSEAREQLAGSAQERLGVRAEQRRILGLGRAARILPTASAWHVGALLIGESDIWATGQIFRAREEARRGFAAESQRARAELQAAAYRGGFAEGETVHLDWTPIDLASVAAGDQAGAIFIDAARGEAMLRWSPSAAPRTLAAYLEDMLALR